MRFYHAGRDLMLGNGYQILSSHVRVFSVPEYLSVDLPT